MKVLWLSNRLFSPVPDSSSGTWLTVMGNALAASGEVQLANISQDKVGAITRCDCNGIAQWAVPYDNLKNDGLPPQKTVEAIQKAVAEFSPDLIHVWGTECYWGLLTARQLLPGRALLDMQGLKYACAQAYYGGLTFTELLRCIGPKELLLPKSSIFLTRRSFQNWGRFEAEMIRGHRYVSTQSDWIRSHVAAITGSAQVFETGILLRPEFLAAKPWTPPAAGLPTFFTSCGCSTAYKGLHTVLHALAIVKHRHPGVVLNVAGHRPRTGLRRSGYEHYVEREVRALGLSDHVRWLGPLDAGGLIREMCRASAVVVPSFVESYSLAMAEAMSLGAPTVASYAGAMPELAKHEESALFFPPGDAMFCASLLARLVSPDGKAERIGRNARVAALQRHAPEPVVRRQMQIYHAVCGNVHAGNP